MCVTFATFTGCSSEASFRLIAESIPRLVDAYVDYLRGAGACRADGRCNYLFTSQCGLHGSTMGSCNCVARGVGNGDVDVDDDVAVLGPSIPRSLHIERSDEFTVGGDSRELPNSTDRPNAVDDDRHGGDRGDGRGVFNSANALESDRIGGAISQHSSRIECANIDATAATSAMSARGPNYERNRRSRLEKKKRRDQFKVEQKRFEPNQVSEHPNGFWSSCSASVRKELIESKARMHIAENDLKTKAARIKCSDADSPFSLMQKAVNMADYAEKQAAKQNNGRIFGWAQTVATSSAESLAKSVPSSVPSLPEVDANVVSSQTSFEAFEFRIAEKNAEIQALRNQHDELEMTIAELRLAKGIVDDSVNVMCNSKFLEGPSVISGKARSTKQRAACRAQPWPHVQISRAEVYDEEY